MRGRGGMTDKVGVSDFTYFGMLIYIYIYIYIYIGSKLMQFNNLTLYNVLPEDGSRSRNML
jgi:hypothetical protein